jgi:hypothetical protein
MKGNNRVSQTGAGAQKSVTRLSWTYSSLSEHPSDPEKLVNFRTCSVTGREFGCMAARPSPKGPSLSKKNENCKLKKKMKKKIEKKCKM